MRAIFGCPRFMLSAALLGAAAFAAPVVAVAEEGSRLVGAAAFGGWQSDAPGTRRLITPADLPSPFATRSVGNGAGVWSRPEGAWPKVPEGFEVDLLADGLVGPRTLTVAPNGDVFVAESAAGRVSVLRPNLAGVPAREVFAENLNAPYGVAFYPPGPDPEWLYVAETGAVLRYPYQRGAMRAADRPQTVIADLPQGGHWTRDIAFSRDGSRLFVAVGSLSNVARGLARITAEQIASIEQKKGRGAAWGQEEDRAAVLSFTPDGQAPRIHASGVRNCSGLTVQPATGAVWCATNERDGLGDKLPPDYATSLRQGGFYGWPWFYIGANEDPRHAGARPDLADDVIVPDVLFQPHSAPLGIAFYDGDAFPDDYHGDAFVTFHGSWNSSERTGYKVVRLLMEDGVATGVYEDFMTGFVISDDRVWGRPVGVAVDADGALLVSEDGNGTIWRVRAVKPGSP
ncbi:MAG: PQQ-dependent sugar dehydrogenase [Alphaproteobacteria bacterium]